MTSLKELYLKLHTLETNLSHINLIKSYIFEEQASLRLELQKSKEELQQLKSTPLFIGQFIEMVDKNSAIVQVSHGTTCLVQISSTVNRELLKPGTSVCNYKKSSAIVDILPPEADSQIKMMTDKERPNVSYSDIGGYDIQKQEIRESVELPLNSLHLFQELGIEPPRGCLMYGPPGCGKTMLAKAVAHHTKANFISIVGSEFAQVYLGEGPRMVRDVFRLAKENAPSIIFIDEVDSIATKRHDSESGADREMQRVLIELLAQMDGFDQTTNVKVIMATNRPDALDPALLRPGRLDRKIEFPLPDRRQKRLIFQVCTSKMNLSKEVDLEDYSSRPDKISGAEIESICQEAGMHAVRKNRYIVIPADFEKAYKKVVKKQQNVMDFYR